MKSKLLSNAGESIAETLVALLIAALSIVMVTGSVVTAARINKRTADQETDFVIPAETSSNTVQSNAVLTIDDKGIDDIKGDGTPESIVVKIKKTDSGYCYYEYKYSEPAGTGSETGSDG